MVAGKQAVIDGIVQILMQLLQKGTSDYSIGYLVKMYSDIFDDCALWDSYRIKILLANCPESDVILDLS